MKKNYSKPDILFESFSLSTDIAGGCEVKIATPSANQCGIRIAGNEVVFLENISGCATVVEDGSDDLAALNGLCYHVPNQSYNLFNS